MHLIDDLYHQITSKPSLHLVKEFFGPFFLLTCPYCVTLRTELMWLQSAASYCPQNNDIPQGAFTNSGQRLSSTEAEPHTNSQWAGFELRHWLYSFSLYSSIQNNKENQAQMGPMGDGDWGWQRCAAGTASMRIHVLKHMELEKSLCYSIDQHACLR